MIIDELFFSSFLSMSSAVGRILLIVAIGGILVRRNYIKSEWVKGLAGITVNIFTPALIFTKVVKGFSPESMPLWWAVPLIVILVGLSGVGIASLLFAGNFKAKSSLFAVSAFHNANYLILPIGLLIYPDRFDEFATYVFLVVLGISPLLWSIGKFLVTPRDEIGFSFKAFITPPFIANFLGMGVVLLGVKPYIPTFLFEPAEMIGVAAVPSGNLILGATLGAISLRMLPPFWDVLRVLFVKYVAIPSVVLAIIVYFDIYQANSLLAELAIIQAASAPAASLIIQVRNYGGNTQEIGSHMLISYILVLVSIPFWLSLLRFVVV